MAANLLFSQIEKAKKPMIIIGQGALNRADSTAILGAVSRIAKDTGVVTASWNGFNVLHTAAGRVAGLDMGRSLLKAVKTQTRC